MPSNFQISVMPIPLSLGAEPENFRAQLFLPEQPLGAVVAAFGGGLPALQAEDLAMHGLAVIIIRDGQHAEESCERIRLAAKWLQSDHRTCQLPIALFGAGRDASAALKVAADAGAWLAGLVTCGGAESFENEHLDQLQAPASFVNFGGDDLDDELNQAAALAVRGQAAALRASSERMLAGLVASIFRKGPGQCQGRIL